MGDEAIFSIFQINLSALDASATVEVRIMVCHSYGPHMMYHDHGYCMTFIEFVACFA